MIEFWHFNQTARLFHMHVQRLALDQKFSCKGKNGSAQKKDVLKCKILAPYKVTNTAHTTHKATVSPQKKNGDSHLSKHKVLPYPVTTWLTLSLLLVTFIEMNVLGVSLHTDSIQPDANLLVSDNSVSFKLYLYLSRSVRKKKITLNTIQYNKWKWLQIIFHVSGLDWRIKGQWALC